MMRLILAALLTAQSALAGLPPTSVKASGDANPVTSFEFDFPNIPFTHTGVKASMNAIPNAALVNSSATVAGVTCTLGSACSLTSGSGVQSGNGTGGFTATTVGNVTGNGMTITGGTGAVIGAGLTVTLTANNDLWVTRTGTDASGCGSIANPCHTVGYAIGLVTSPGSTNTWAIHISGRNDAEASDLLLPIYTFIVGSGGPDVGSYLRLPAGKAIKASSGWTANTRGGIQSVYLGGGTSINLDLVGIGGSAGSTFMLDDVFVTGSVTHAGRGINGGDFLYVQNSYIFGNTSLTGSELQSLNSTWGGSLTATTSTTVTSDLTLIGGAVAGAFSFTETNALAATLATQGTTYNSTFTTTGTLTLTADGNLPIGYSLSGGTTRTNLVDAKSLAYTPTTSANWNSVPALTATGLDTLASSGVVKSQSQNLVFASPNGSSGLMTPRALVAADLPTLGTGAGSCTNCSVTFDAQGRETAYSSGSAPVTTMGAFGSSPNSNGATISGNTLTLQPADASNPGGVSTATQTLAGAKTFSSAPTFSTMTVGSVLFAGTSGLVSQDNTNLFWDTTTTALSVGGGPHPATSADLAITSQAADTKVGLSVFDTGSNNAVQIQNQSAFSLAALAASATNSPSINFERARGTLAAKTQAKAGDILGSFVFNGYTGSADGAFSAGFGSVATEDQSSGHAGGEILFQTTPNSSSTLVTRLVIDQNGNVQIPGLTASRAIVTDASSNLASSATTGTQVGYLSGATGTTGTGNLVLASAPTLTNPVVGTQSTGDNSTKAASTAFVQTALAQLNPAAAVVAASTANIAGTYTNAVGGVCIGDTFQVTSTSAFAPDGVTLTVGQRFLMKDQSSSFQNGVWTLTTAANVGVLGALLTRALDFDSSADINAGQIVPVSGGTVNAGSSWYQTANVTTCNSDAQTWTEFQKAISAYASSTLTNTHILVGNASAVATDVAASGDLTLANTGAFTIANAAVTNAKIANATIDLTTKVTGVLPSANVGGGRTINAQTGTTYTFVLADGANAGGLPLVTLSNASAITATVPPNSSVAYPVGDQIDSCQIGAGKVTYAAGAGVTINSKGSNLSAGGQYVCTSLVKTATNTWILIGDLIADALRLLGLKLYA